jgi:hypothetical protein
LSTMQVVHTLPWAQPRVRAHQHPWYCLPAGMAQTYS